MEPSDKYVQRVSNKYNRRHVMAFVQKRAERRVLGPLGLSLSRWPPASFGDDRSRLSRGEEFELFVALHYIKYKITKTKRSKCKERYVQIYIVLRNRAISANWPLVLDCVKRHAGRFKSWIDKAQLIEHGYLSLLNAVDGFDPWRGYRFCTYACTAITRSFFDRNQVTRIMLPIDDVEVNSESPDEDHELWLERLNIVLQSDDLSFREKEILRHRFYEKKTLKETGIIWGITKERIRQIQKRAIVKLKESLDKDPILS